MAVDFRKQLRHQLTFLKNSAARYDYGCHEEAVRIATVIRVIIHDTKRCTSLLKHLNAERVPLLDTAGSEPDRLSVWDPLTAFTRNGTCPKFGGSGNQSSGVIA